MVIEKKAGIKSLRKKAIGLGAMWLDFSPRRNRKYLVLLKNGKSIHFGDYVTHGDAFKRYLYRLRVSKTVDVSERPVIDDIESPIYWESRLLW